MTKLKNLSDRDYFAALALQGLIQKAPSLIASLTDEQAMKLIHQSTADIVHSAYRYADAMLVERDK